MSFYRVGQNRKKRISSRKKPAWDDTVQDLTVLKATPEEIMLRKEAHKSKNHLSVKLEKIHKEKQKSKLTGTEAQQLAIMKEILYDQNQLQEVLSKSDTMMAVVKDLFGDDPKRFMGFPNVTTAPHGGDQNSLVAPVADIYTRTEKLSDSLMDQSALNDDLDTSDSDDQFDCPRPISYESKINLQHFEDYLQEEKSKTARLAPHELSKANVNNNMVRNIHEVKTSTDAHDDAGKIGPAFPLLKTLLNHSERGQSDQLGLPDPNKLALLLGMLTAKPATDFKTPPKERQHLPSDRTPPSAMNDTKKIKRSKKVSQSQNTSSESISSTSNVNSMRQVLQELENEMAEYENETGRHPQTAAHKTETFSGYTVSLVSAVSRLTRYLREMELRVQTEATLREHLTQDVCQLRTVIDALATDLIVTREEYQKLYWESKHYRDSTESKLASTNNQLVELQRLVNGSEPRSSVMSQTKDEQDKPLDQHQGHYKSSDKQPATFHMSTPLQDDGSTQSDLESSIYHPLPTHLKSGPAPAAVMLSPPVRKTRVQSSAGSRGQPLQCQTSLVSQAASEGTNYCADPPRLTQTPPVMNTVSVPRPVPLVQTNLNFALTSGLSVNQATVSSAASDQGVRATEKVGTGSSVHNVPDVVKYGDNSQRLQELAVDEALSDPDMQSLMQAQLAELNRQQEEARHRLLDLLEKQKLQQKFLQDQCDSETALDSYRKECSDRQGNMLKQPVSPPISPILERTEQAGQERGIAVSLSNIKLDA